MTYTNKVLLIYTGGTIGMNRNPRTGALEPFNFESLLNNVPELQQVPTEIATYQFNPPIDSSDMSPELWIDMAHVIQQLQPLRWVCDSSWYGHYGLYGIGPELYA